jgi:hypothetical protein
VNNAELREMLIQARADTYDNAGRILREVITDESLPDDIAMELYQRLMAEQNMVWDEFTKRIKAIPADTE